MRMKNRYRRIIKIVGLVLLGLLFLISPAFLAIKAQKQCIHIEESETKTVIAHYKRYHGTSHDGRADVIEVLFTDHDSLFLNWRQAKARAKLKELSLGAELTIKTHPNTNEIMRIDCGETTILGFDYILKALDTERIVFLIIAIICYSAYFVFVISVLLCIRKERRDRSSGPLSRFSAN